MGEAEDEKNQAGRLFENFVQATDCKSTLQAFNIMCSYLELDPLEHSTFYSALKSTVTSWKAKALWSKLDKRASHKEYKKGKACEGIKVSLQNAKTITILEYVMSWQRDLYEPNIYRFLLRFSLIMGYDFCTLWHHYIYMTSWTHVVH